MLCIGRLIVIYTRKDTASPFVCPVSAEDIEIRERSAIMTLSPGRYDNFSLWFQYRSGGQPDYLILEGPWLNVKALFY